MEFYKDTIIGQVIKEVHKNKHNEIYLSQIDDLIDEIFDQDYLHTEIVPWQKQNLFIVDFISDETKEKNKDYFYVVSENVYEYSWLVERLVEIYSPDSLSLKRLLNTIGYLLQVYDEKIDDLVEILRITATASIIFLHPDHLGKDRFKVKPISLPPFGFDY